MKNLILLLLFIIPLVSISQTTELDSDLSMKNSKFSELTLFLGLSSYEGDLHSFDDDNLGVTTNAKFSFGLRYSKNFNRRMAASVSYTFARIEGDDNAFTEESGHPARSFNFSNTIHEIALRGDYTPFGEKKWKVQPFVFAGLGFALGGADANFDNQVDSPVSDELIRDDMENGKKPSFVLPIGFGIKASVTEKITIGLEAGLRIFGNDYLDGVSQSANPEIRDFYGMGGATIAYRL